MNRSPQSLTQGKERKKKKKTFLVNLTILIFSVPHITYIKQIS